MSGVSARNIRRRLSRISGLFAFLRVRGDVATNPAPRGLPTRRKRQPPGQGVPLVRTTRTLPLIQGPDEVDALTALLRTHRDQAMVSAMVPGGPRRCEVLGLRWGDLRMAERRVSAGSRSATDLTELKDLTDRQTPFAITVRRVRPRRLIVSLSRSTGGRGQLVS
jgi:integrase